MQTSDEGRTPSHDENDDCPVCYECPGCGGGDGSMPKRTRLVRREGAVLAVCDDCGGDGILCPHYVPSPEFAAEREARRV